MGEAKDTLQVHVDKICEASSFFRSAFTSRFKESMEKPIHLPEDNIDTVDSFVQWLYTSHYELPAYGDFEEEGGSLWWQPMRLLIFSDKYDVPELRKLIFRLMLSCIKDEVKTRVDCILEWVYLNTCRGSGTRRLLIDWYASRDLEEKLESPDVEDFLIRVPEFTMDLLIAMDKILAARKQSYPIEKNNFEHYLDREDGHEATNDGSSSDSS